MASAAELERRAERARERLIGRISDLRYRFSPSTIANDLFGIDLGTAGKELLPAITQQIRSNPLAFALIAAGVGWLIISDLNSPVTRTPSGRRKAQHTRRMSTRKKSK